MMNVWMDGGRMMDGWRRSWLNESPHRDPVTLVLLRLSGGCGSVAAKPPEPAAIVTDAV